ncbi:MAG TPA: prephenate dehydratase [Pyrodictium sp.]|nr:prephenate dehydratase [Pyrodictium sp.]
MTAWSVSGLGVGVIVRVAFLGPEHSFTHMAAEKLFPGAELVPCNSITKVFRLVEAYEVDYGVVPVENSLEGPVGETLDNLATTMLHIYAALEMGIALVLAGRKGAGKIYGHPHALREAARSLERLAPGAELVPVPSTSHAARQAAEEDVLCVCSRRAAEAYSLEIIAEGLEDGPNYTRFIALAWRDQPENAERTSIIAAFPDEPGSLYRFLEPFARHGVNLKMIYSRPIPGKPWHYNFYIDLEGSRLDRHVAEALEEAAARSLFIHVLGSYPVQRD